MNKTKKRLEDKLKKVLAIIVSILIIMQLLVSTITFARASTILGTNKALGSPILDTNFQAEDWNKWEMIVWGIFLSNFPVPLIDDYESAFNSNSGRGSKGAGYRALVFGSGGDSVNSETIKKLLDYAIQQQKAGSLQPIRVAFNKVSRNKIDKTAPTDAGTREATFKDLFIMSSSKDGSCWVKLDNTKGLNNQSSQVIPIEGHQAYEGWLQEWGKSKRYVSIATINEGSLPTFYIKSGSGYETIFDYTDGWDAQILTAWIARIACGPHKDEFVDLFNDMWSKSSDLKLYLDVFGNIVTIYNGTRRIIIPASINQHLTTNPKINLLSSLIFNGYNMNITATDLQLRGQQSVSGWFGTNWNVDVRFGGLPALGSHLTGLPQGLILFYYDLDTIMQNTYFNGGYAANGTKTVSDETVNGGKVYNVHYGKALKELFDLDASKELGNKYIFKLEASNMSKFDFKKFSDGKAGEALSTMLNASGQIANIVGAKSNAKVLTKIKTDTSDISLFGKPILIPVQMDKGVNGNGKLNDAGVGRQFIQYLYDIYKNGDNSIAGIIDKSLVETLMISNSSASMSGFKSTILGSDAGKISKILAGFIANKPELLDIKVDASKLVLGDIKDKTNPFEGLKDTTIDGKKAIDIKFDTNASLDYFPGRVILAYPVSDAMLAAGNVLGLKEGTEFSVYSTYIYMTYLDWYGVKSSKLTGAVSSELNPKIFNEGSDVLKVDIKSLVNVKTEEDKKKDILNYTYMMLHPQDGKEYRREVMMGYLNNFLYDSYQKIVYGGATSYSTGTYDNIATRHSTGFMALDTYQENFMTAWFMKLYPKIAMTLIALSFILIIIIGLLKGRKISWYLIAITVVVNAILIVPSAGEITPAVINNYVQKLFSDKMTFWAISESVRNAKLESKAVNGATDYFLSNLSDSDRKLAAELVKKLNVVYLDRALMIKTDISRKLTQTASGNFAEIQKLRSARWLLPMIIRQFTASDGSANYVYIPLGDIYDDMSNLYWMYKPEDAKFSGTITGSQETATDGVTLINTEKPLTLAERKQYFNDYIDTVTKSSAYDIKYRSEAYYRGKSLEDLPHTYFYILKSQAIPVTRSYGFGGSYKDKKSFKDYVTNSIKAGKSQGFLSTALKLEQEAGTYNRFDRSTMKQSYGYLMATETPFYYFYQVIKDSFNSDISLGALIGKIQGRYVKTDNGEVRESFMHAEETGYIKDILDLEEMFTNMIPYLYQMQITAGGLDGESGVLGDKKIEEYEIYKNNLKSWLFRSNWATKLMEMPDYSSPVTVRDSKGNKVKILNPMLTECYKSDRPMVFSEAQMHALGLSEDDLNLVELKAIKVNKDVARRWTLLLNYANTPGMTKEVLMRQMATEALLAFNKEFSPKGMLNTEYTLYPTGLDLRALSFDAIMKMLLLNSTKNVAYIYGDTMENFIQNSDIFSAMLLLIASFLCAYVIPFVRNVAMGLIFFLGFASIIYSLFASNTHKAKVSFGFIVSNILILVMTIAYYAVFSALMSATTADALINVQQIEINSGNPVWTFIIIIIASVIYIIGLFKMINFCFKHYRDMGYEVYMAVAGTLTERIAGGIERLGDKIATFGMDNPSPSKEAKYKGTLDNEYLRSNIEENKASSAGYSDRGKSDKSNIEFNEDKVSKDYDTHEYKYSNIEYDDSKDIEDIEREIKKGKELEKDENRHHTKKDRK